MHQNDENLVTLFIIQTNKKLALKMKHIIIETYFKIDNICA